MSGLDDKKKRLVNILTVASRYRTMMDKLDLFKKIVLLINNRKLSLDDISREVYSLEDFIDAHNRSLNAGAYKGIYTLDDKSKYLLGIPVKLLEEIQDISEEGKKIYEMCIDLLEPIDKRREYKADKIRESALERLSELQEYTGNDEECIAKKKLLEKYANDPNTYRLVNVYMMITKIILSRKLEFKYEFSHTAEGAIKKLVSGDGKNLSDEEKDILRLVAYSSEYLPNAENSAVLREDFDEATLLINMKNAGSPLMLSEEEIDGKKGIPFINETLYLSWFERFRDRRDAIISADEENVLEGQVSFYDNIDMLRGIRNAIAHGGFIYDPTQKLLHLNSQVGLEEGKTGYLEISLDRDCIFDLCDNYFSIENESTVLNGLNTGLDENTKIDYSEVFRYYINSIFAYNGWILSEDAFKVRQVEPLKSNLEKFCSYFIDETTGESYISNLEALEKEEQKAGVIVSLLNDIRNGSVHARLDSKGENICIDIPEEKDEEGNIVKPKTIVSISEENFKKLVQELNITESIEDAISQMFLPEYREVVENIRDVEEANNDLKSRLDKLRELFVGEDSYIYETIVKKVDGYDFTDGSEIR